MTERDSQLNLYRAIGKMGDTPRETEAKVLTKGALKLQECIDCWDSEERRDLLAAALRFNQQIWSIFQIDLTSKECRLPKELRANLLTLGAFVDKQIFSIMAFPAPDKLFPLIQINLNLAEGLRQRPATGSEPQGSAPAMHLSLNVEG